MRRDAKKRPKSSRRKQDIFTPGFTPDYVFKNRTHSWRLLSLPGNPVSIRLSERCEKSGRFLLPNQPVAHVGRYRTGWLAQPVGDCPQLEKRNAGSACVSTMGAPRDASGPDPEPFGSSRVVAFQPHQAHRQAPGARDAHNSSTDVSNLGSQRWFEKSPGLNNKHRRGH